MDFFPSRIISGGQTGVDRGALEAAIIVGIETGGWCPRNRRAEDGIIPAKYAVLELGSVGYESRTEKNVMESDATMILCRGLLSGGTAYTVDMAKKHIRPVLIINPDDPKSIGQARSWLDSVQPTVLNVAGPRESKDTGIQSCSSDWLTQLFEK